MGIKMGIVGTGVFAQSFIKLFSFHPLVDEVILCDLDEKKLQENKEKHGIQKSCGSLDELCKTNVDAIGIFTQNWMHAPQALQALKAGKHVYSAVPAGMSVQEIEALVKAVDETGLVYMMGETSFYYPEVILCRDEYKKGTFGKVVFAEAAYYHDFDHGLYEVYQHRGGKNWIEEASVPPMYYPTHSVSQVVSVTGAYVTHVSCLGFKDCWNDGIFVKEASRYGNEFSNETALMRMSDGSCCRINEYRRLAGKGEGLGLRFFGTDACFRDSKLYMRKDMEVVDVENTIKLSRVQNPENTGDIHDIYETRFGFAPIHHAEKLPLELLEAKPGHKGSHHFLVNDFVNAVINNTMPLNNIWQAARYNIPGIIAHESAVKGGIQLEVPDFGEAPVK